MNHDAPVTRTYPLLTASEAGLYDSDLTRFLLHAEPVSTSLENAIVRQDWISAAISPKRERFAERSRAV
ncbi:hypothetical protein NB311A_06286 [Nitrobacter sp. Nb-311A]|nr:hypothetical protein NB311A_06286 [Nitrobacter sp. Nb-311A]